MDDLKSLYWTRQELLAQLRCGPATLRALTTRTDDRLPSRRIGRRVLYPKAEVTAWLERGEALPLSA